MKKNLNLLFIMYEFNNSILITLSYKRYCILNGKIIRIQIIFD